MQRWWLPELSWKGTSACAALRTQQKTLKPWHVVDTEFWRLIAQHRHTHSPFPLTDSEYAQRAKEIFECLEDIPIDQASDKLSYATSANHSA
jgi:hypothetical protein